MRRPPALAVAVAVTVLAVGGVAWAVGGDGDGGGRRDEATTTSSRSALEGSPGERGVGDPYFPDLGNGGYDVERYDLDLTWKADAQVLEGVTTIAATATQDLSRFDLDLSGLEVRSVEVDGTAATFTRDATELVITPAEAIRDGDDLTVEVTYGGEPEPIRQGTDLFEVGWHSDGREAYVASEPAGAATFFPVNDHPSDKATYSFEVTVPSDLVVATNGLTSARVDNRDGTTTWSSSARDPIASYLVQVAIGDYEVVDGGRSAGGVPIRHVLHRDHLPAARETLARTAEMLDVMAGVWGPYPFEVYGVLVVDEDLGFALETQTLTLLGSGSTGPGDAEGLLVHELAHQWVGNAVSPATWKDIWLNEGMATYGEWMWTERTGGPTAAERARDVRGVGLDAPPGDPGPDELFASTVYQRGALTLQALREEVGDDAFLRILPAWVEEHRHGAAATADFIALSERISGQPLDELFDEWLYGQGLPRRSAPGTP